MKPSERRSLELRDAPPAPAAKNPFEGLSEALAAYAGAWLRKLADFGGPFAKKVSKNTVESYRGAIVTFAKWVATSKTPLPPIKSFEGPHASAFVEYLVDRKYKPRSIAVKRAALKSFWNYLCSQGETVINPFEHVVIPAPIPGTPRFFEDPEDLAMIENFHRAGKWCPAFLIMRFAGLRHSETLKLSPDDISLSTNGTMLRIHVRHGKGGKQRWAYMVPRDGRFSDPRLYQRVVMEAARNRAGEELLFEAGEGGLYSTYRTMIKKGLLPKGFAPHRLRHTFATWLERQGYAEEVVCGLMGHENVRTTRVYADRRPEELERELERKFFKERGGSGT